MRKLSLISLLSILFIYNVRPAAAGTFVSVSPTVTEKAVDPGKRVPGKLKISNSTGGDVWIRIEAKDWWKENTGFKLPDLDSWFSIQPKTPFRLKAGQTRIIKYWTRVPRGTEGELAAMVFFVSDPIGEKKGGIMLQTRHGVPVYVLVKGTEKVQADVIPTALRLTQDAEGAKLEFTLSIKNTGNIHVRPKGSVQISTPGGKTVEAPIDWGFPVYPEKTDKFSARTKSMDWQPGRYRAEALVDIGGFAVGTTIRKAFEFEVTDTKEIKILE